MIEVRPFSSLGGANHGWLDAHHHFWDPARNYHPWLCDEPMIPFRYGDYGAIFRYTPRSVSQTEMHITWLVRGDAEEGADYDRDRLTWMWRVTGSADKRIVEENQKGVASRYYRPGPYALPIESGTQRLSQWYLSELSASR